MYCFKFQIEVQMFRKITLDNNTENTYKLYINFTTKIDLI